MTTAAFCSVLVLATAVSDADEPRRATSQSSITISTQSSSSVDENGERKTTKGGRVTITGPDGKQQEIEFDTDADGRLQLDGINLPAAKLLLQNSASTEPRPMIGVACRPVPELFRKHLKLGVNGVEVRSVAKDLPAAEAGIVSGDIILKADGKNITTQSDLAVVVKESGQRQIVIELLHEGDLKTVTLKPVEKAPSDIDLPGVSGAASVDGQSVFWKNLGPAMMLEIDEHTDEHVKQLLQHARKATENLERDTAEADRKQTEALLRRLQKVEEELRELKQQDEAKSDRKEKQKAAERE